MFVVTHTDQRNTVSMKSINRLFEINISPIEGHRRTEVTEYTPINNEIMAISPYKRNGMWMFDDDRVGLVEELFVVDTDTLIDVVTADIPNAEDGFNMIFSANPFPGHDLMTEFVEVAEPLGNDPDEEPNARISGSWYYNEEHDIKHWLCPALFHYFPEPPERIYIQFRPL